MQHKRTFPATLYLQTKSYNFCLVWSEPNILNIEAIKKTQPTKCFRGKLTNEQLQKGTSINSLFNFLQEKTLQSSITKADYLSLIITIIDQTQQDKGYSCRIIFQDKIKSIKVEPNVVSETYFLSKKIEALEQEKNSDRIMIAEFGNQLTKRLQEKDYDMKKTLTEQMQGMISAVTNRIEKQFQQRSKVFNPIANGEIQIDSIPNVKKIQKKIRKKIKKQIRQKKKAKKHKERQKKKKRKAKRKQKKRIKALLQAQQNGDALPEKILVDSNSPPLIQPNQNNNLPENIENLLDVDQMPFINQDGIQHNKKKKKKQKHKHQQKNDNPIIHIKPQNTSLVSMSKLRTRGGIDFARIDNPIEIIQQDIKQGKMKKQKRSKQKKNKTKQKKNKNKQVQQIQQIQQQGEKQYYRRLEQLRRAGNIDQVRVTKTNRNKPILAVPKQPLTEIDEFNPKYNGQPKYKPFVGLNEFQAVRPGQIFTQRFEAIGSECKKIPINFREQIPSYKNFDVNGSVIRKKQGLNYQQMVFDYLLPQTGKHVLTMRLIQTKRMYIWFGIIDLRQKDREQSFNKKNCITFSFRTGHIATSNKWSRSKIGRMQVGLSIRMQIDMDKNSIIWYISDGRNNIAPIPKLMRKLMLVPYFQMMDVGDQICFQQ